MIQNQFDIRRPYEGWRLSRVTDVAMACPRGTAFGYDATTADKIVLAGGKNFLGFVMREVVVGGPGLPDHVYPNRLELAYASGQEASLEKADEVEAEGSNFLVLSGTGALANNTAVDTQISFNNGKFYIAQTGDIPFYKVSANPNMLAAAGVNPVVPGALRFRFEINNR